ncbi:HAD family acid phosphatase [Aeromonas veronii]|uniref:HAD family acid phosphatase n=1 Tax=Aeromonas veronii TaxID=654 RepID=UPI0018F14A86|nr:HAD family acid phosphatase [Aeromonas veronii]MBJ7591968.1 hypothetical protein [Aeromonas veronii]
MTELIYPDSKILLGVDASSQMLLACDIDGTLVNNLGRADLMPTSNLHDPQSWENFNQACEQDKPIRYRLAMLHLLAPHYQLVYLTGRARASMASTRSSLKAIAAPPAPLFMRDDNDGRTAAEYKADQIRRLLTIFKKEPHELVLIDDDSSICDHIRATFLGATIIQVPSECAAQLRAEGTLVHHLQQHQKGKEAQA